ncbi:MAG: long-chain fatty acid--CoA ligase [Thermodesulfobacteriota bacterium]|nr:long-chain fatty acid--CoA ligase [Thermodesulfobacteriota bacterium]
MTENIGALLAESSKRHAQRLALKGRSGKRFEETSYGDLYELVMNFGSGLISLDVMPFDRVFILSDNRKEWLVSNISVMSIGAIDISRGSDSTPSEIEYILNHSSPAVIIVENRQQLKKVTSLKAMPAGVKKIVVLEDKEGGERKENVSAFDEVLAQGAKCLKEKDNSFESRLKAVRLEDIATIVYTSGTTGPPKGVMLTHQNIVSNVEATLKSIEISPDDRLLSILPSWHMFERMVEYVILSRGAGIVYTNPRNIGRDMISEKPTHIVGVPRVWEAFYERVSKKFKQEKAVTRKTIDILSALGRKYIFAGRVIHNEELEFVRRKIILLGKCRAFIMRSLLKPAYWLGDILVYEKVRKATGGHLRAAISGGGSFPSYLDEFFEMAGIDVVNGYGLTETSPILTMRTLDHNVRGTVGRPISGTEINIVDEKGNDVPQGEQGLILARGQQVMKGYFKDEEATGKVMKEGGWFDTGDLGKITLSGDLVITGRAKDTIVLLGGENVEPEPIEMVLKESDYIENVMVVGQDRKHLAALICPNYPMLSEYLGERETKPENILQDSSVDDLIKKEIAARIQEANGFKSHERIIKFTLMKEDWSRENGLLTATLKLKRNVITERYQSVIKAMYE